MSDDEGVREGDARDVEALVRARAHELWETEGRPMNRAAEHWARARREVLGSDPETSPAAASSSGGAATDPGGTEVGSGAAILGGMSSAETGPVGAAAGAPSLSLDLPRDPLPGTPDAPSDAETATEMGAGGLPEGDPGAVGLAEHPSPDAARSTSGPGADHQPGPLAPDLSLPGVDAVPTGGLSGASPSGTRGSRQGAGARADEPGPRVGRRPGAEQGRAGSPGTAMTIAAVALGALFLAVRSRRR